MLAGLSYLGLNPDCRLNHLRSTCGRSPPSGWKGPEINLREKSVYRTSNALGYSSSNRKFTQFQTRSILKLKPKVQLASGPCTETSYALQNWKNIFSIRALWELPRKLICVSWRKPEIAWGSSQNVENEGVWNTLEVIIVYFDLSLWSEVICNLNRLSLNKN